MFNINTIFYTIYNLVAFFYLVSGVLLLLYPAIIKDRIKKLFPLLASWHFSRLYTSLNLILVGAVLLTIGKLINFDNIWGYFFVIILSGLEVYLGFKFYYFEERDIPQATIHVILHTFIVVLIIWFILTYLSNEIISTQENLTTVLQAIL